MKSHLILFVLITSFVITPASAQDKADFSADFSALTMTGEAQVEQVIDPLRLKLLDQRIIQLTGIDIPDLTPYDTGDIGMKAVELLKEKLERRHIKIYQSKNADKGRTNRMGYQLAHITLKSNDEWIQGALISEGLARVRPSTINHEMGSQMLAKELAARTDKKGLWQDEQYAVLSPETAGKAMHGWAIIEGTVRASAMAGNNIYLNFGQDWRSDFTVGITPAVRREITKQQGGNPLQYANRTIRVRGWVEDYNGPYIELMHPVWLEVLPETQ